MLFTAVLGVNSQDLKYNHGKGKGLTVIPFEDTVIPQGVRTALYRHYSKTGELLYVGISLSALARIGQHLKATYDWTDDISNMTIEWLDSRPAALRAEKNAIKAEHPKYNVQHNKAVLKV